MADESKEQKWSCGCHVVDGKLVAECTQTAPTGEISAERHGVLKPYAAKCGRKAALNAPAKLTVVPQLAGQTPEIAQTQVTKSDAQEQPDSPKPAQTSVESGSTQVEQSAGGDTAQPTLSE